MRVASEVVVAARRILHGDDSTLAGAALEEALHAHHAYEDEFEDLLEALALYPPGMGSPYIDHDQLCEAIHAASYEGWTADFTPAGSERRALGIRVG